MKRAPSQLTEKKKIDYLKKKTKCNYCKKIGHWARECRKRKEDEASAKDKKHSDGSGASTYVCDLSSFFLETSENDDTAWIADSGASMRMTSHREYFRELTSETSVQYVKIADNKVLQTAGIGVIDIRVEVNGTLHDRQLSNVLYVPNLSRNLFSVGAVNDKKFSFHSYKDHCEVRDSSNNISSIGLS